MAEPVRGQYYSIVTNIGKTIISNAIALGTPVDFAEIGYGDGAGTAYDPTEDQTQLRGQKHKSRIYDILVYEDINQIEIQGLIPATVGGFVAREAGIYDSKGNLLIISKLPESTKPIMEEGSTVDIYLKIRLEISNTSIVNLTVDPSALLVNINQFNQYKQEMQDLYLDLKDQVEETLSGGVLEELIITLSTDLQNHIDKEITKDEVHGFSLITEELYRNTDSDGKVPIKIKKENIKGTFNISEIEGKATTEDVSKGINNEKYVTPYAIKDALVSASSTTKAIYDEGLETQPVELYDSRDKKNTNDITFNMVEGEPYKVRLSTINTIDISYYNYVIFTVSGGGYFQFQAEIADGKTPSAEVTNLKFGANFKNQDGPGGGEVAYIVLNIGEMTGEKYIRISSLPKSRIWGKLKKIELTKELPVYMIPF